LLQALKARDYDSSHSGWRFIALPLATLSFAVSAPATLGTLQQLCHYYCFATATALLLLPSSLYVTSSSHSTNDKDQK
jgi:hypothetical protein